MPVHYKALSSAVVGPFRAVVADGPHARARARDLSQFTGTALAFRHGAPTAAALIYINFRRVHMRINALAAGAHSPSSPPLSLSLSCCSLSTFLRETDGPRFRAFDAKIRETNVGRNRPRK